MRASHLRRAGLLAALLVLLAAPPAPADTVVLTPVKDNTISEEWYGSNGAGPTLITGLSCCGRYHALLQFDIAGNIPAGATIDAAALRINYVHSNNSGLEDPGGYGLHVLLSDWGEGASNSGGFPGAGGMAPPVPPDATWIEAFFPGLFWVTPGGDFAAAASAAISIPSNDCSIFGGTNLECGLYTWSSPAMAADVQGWLDDPGSNFGWLLKAELESLGRVARGFESREGGVPPELEITFTATTCDSIRDLATAIRDPLITGQFIFAGYQRIMGYIADAAALNCDIQDFRDTVTLLNRIVQFTDGLFPPADWMIPGPARDAIHAEAVLLRDFYQAFLP